MAYPNALRSPNKDAFPANSYSSQMRPAPIGSQLASNTSTTSAERAQLHRRFTTNALPTVPTLASLGGPLSPLGQLRRQAGGDPDLAAATLHKLQLLQKRKNELERSDQRRAYQNALETVEYSNEIQRLENDIRLLSMSGNANSEPTTPPEYRDGSQANNNARANRLSLASMTSTPGIGSIASPRTNRSGSQSVNTPYSQMSQGGLPSFSVPPSRRGSDEEDDHFSVDLATFNPSRRLNGVNRNSMPAMSSNSFEYSKMQQEVLGYKNIASILSDDSDDGPSHGSMSGVAESISQLHMDVTADGFPLLRRRDTDADDASQDFRSNAQRWSDTHRHRPGQQSLPTNQFRNSLHEEIDSNIFESLKKKANANNRRSMDVYSSGFGTASKRSSLHSVTNGYTNGVPKLQSSYSTNDIPTVKNAGIHEQNAGAGTSMTHAEQHLHNHNASIGRIPMSASNRQSRDLSAFEYRGDETSIPAFSSALQASAPAFSAYQAHHSNNTNSGASHQAMSGHSSAFSQYVPGVPGYNIPMPVMTYGAPQTGWANPGYASYQYNPFGGSGYGRGFQQPDSQRNVMKARKAEDDGARFAHHNIENMHGQLYDMCKDQHGCRFLQRKIEERNAEHIDMIFNETKDHIVELMTDPFGNYLCQKLLEYCTDAQRTTLINNAAPHMGKIAINQHGTRALQKMIEFISTREQIDTIKVALSACVVDLVQDLNGNHVIQKCLNHLKPEDADFIFEEVAYNCLTIGSHRHGCCVIQRCIDHAVGPQKGKLIQAIINQAYPLVQDPFGNYVVQYIVDLGVLEFTRPLCLSFLSHMVELSRNKFSSNVLEKLIRCSPLDIRPQMCEEFMTSPTDMERHIRDAYTNYVIQTILDHAPPATIDRIWATIEPILERVKSTPAGRRIYNKHEALKKMAENGDGPRQLVMGQMNGPMNGVNGLNGLNSLSAMNGGMPVNGLVSLNGLQRVRRDNTADASGVAPLMNGGFYPAQAGGWPTNGNHSTGGASKPGPNFF